MIIKILLYALYTILSAYVESIRIKKGWGKRDNVIKPITWGIALVGFVAISLIFPAGIVGTACFAVAAALTRGVLYDPFLNKFRGLPLEYQSNTTNSIIDPLEAKDFWLQRRQYLYTLIGFTTIFLILEKIFENIIVRF